MGVQQQLLERIGQSLVMQFRDSIEQVRASGRTSESIHAVATDSELEVLADRHIWALEDGRKPTSSGASRGNPTLFEQIKEWAKIRGIITNLQDREQLGIVYAITKKIHKEGWKPTLQQPLTKVIDNIDDGVILRELVAYQSKVLVDRVVTAAKQLE